MFMHQIKGQLRIRNGDNNFFKMKQTSQEIFLEEITRPTLRDPKVTQQNDPKIICQK